ncbi:MAG: hypothetical protein M1823_007438, partial [Watsoniomyces obsoletus]
GNEIRKKGATEDNVSIEAVAKHLQESLERVRSYSLPGTSAAQTLRTQCLSVVDELLKAVNDLKIMGQPTRWKSFRNAIKTVRSKEKIERWTRQLHDLRDEYNLQLEEEILTTLDLAKVEQIDSFKILEQSQQDLILTLANALRDDHDQFEAIAEHHAVSIQQLVQQEHERTRALTLCE